MDSVRRLVSVVDRNLLLHLHGAAHRPVDAVEHDQQRVAAGLDDPATMLRRSLGRSRCGAMPQPFERPCIIQSDQAAVANHIGIDDGDQLPPIW